MNRQASFDIQFERGEAGLHALAPQAATVIIVDVLSFSTAVDVAVARGATVLPCRYADVAAEDLARRCNAYLAVPRNQRDAGQPYSLSPPTLRDLPKGSRLVLPSPNGSTLVTIAAAIAPAARILVGCLRNASAIAGFATQNAVHGPIAVISAGEQWPNETLRPALEDDLGAGAIIVELVEGNASPEARYVAEAFSHMRHRLCADIGACATGAELLEAGYPEDIETACALNSSRTVPLVDPAGRIRDAAQ